MKLGELLNAINYHTKINPHYLDYEYRVQGYADPSRPQYFSFQIGLEEFILDVRN